MQFLIIHGSYGSPDGNWFPQLKENLEALGQTVFAPQFPVDDWEEVTRLGPAASPSNHHFIYHSLRRLRLNPADLHHRHHEPPNRQPPSGYGTFIRFHVSPGGQRRFKYASWLYRRYFPDFHLDRPGPYCSWCRRPLKTRSAPDLV